MAKMLWLFVVAFCNFQSYAQTTTPPAVLVVAAPAAAAVPMVAAPAVVPVVAAVEAEAVPTAEPSASGKWKDPITGIEMANWKWVIFLSVLLCCCCVCFPGGLCGLFYYQRKRKNAQAALYQPVASTRAGKGGIHCVPCKCYPCLKVFECGKLLMALALCIVGVTMIVQEPEVINCNKFTVACPASFGNMLTTVAAAKAPGVVLTPNASAVDSYCGCMSSCMNYFLVYGEDKKSVDKNNCYEKSLLAGVPVAAPTAAPGAVPTAAPVAGTDGMLGLAGKNTCKSCEDIKSGEGSVFRTLGGIAIVCALALALSATCEMHGARTHSCCFSICTLSTDIVVIILLAVAAVISCMWLGLSQLACDPDMLAKQLTKAGAASTDGGEESAAAFFQFLISLLQPLASGLCRQNKKFAVFSLCSLSALLFTNLTVIATLCICCKCTKDGNGEDPYDEAQEMQSLMNSGEEDQREGGGFSQQGY